MKVRPLLVSTLLLFCIGGGVPAWGAPTTTPLTEVESETEPAAAAQESLQPKGAMVDPTAARDVPNPSNTIKMLLELQAAPDSSASANDSGRLPPRSSANRPNPKTPAANPFGNADNPFGASPEFAGPVAASGAARTAIDWQAAQSSGQLTGAFGGTTSGTGVLTDPHLFPAQRPGSSSSTDASEPRWWMPSVWIRWVREHRQEVLIGAAVALGLAWVGASRASPRRP